MHWLPKKIGFWLLVCCFMWSSAVITNTVKGGGSVEQSNPVVNYTLFHARLGQPLRYRGLISVNTTVPPVDPTISAEEESGNYRKALSSPSSPPIKRTLYVDDKMADMTHLTNGTYKDDFYFLSLVPQEPSGKSLKTFNFTVPLCLLQSARFRDQFLFHIAQEGGRPFHVDYYPSAAVCDKKPKRNLKIHFKTTVLLKRLEQAPRPRLQTPVVVPQAEDGSPLPPAPPKSFLQQYWMYLLPVMIILLMGGGGGNAAAAQTGGAGGRTAK